MAERSLDHLKIEGGLFINSPYTLSHPPSPLSTSISQVVLDNNPLNQIQNFKSPSNIHPHTPNVPRSITAHERACRKTSTTATKESRPLNIHQQYHPTNAPTPN
ncbi:hypothetical protein ACN42_g4439 [Penicillium freii]|uniref:Uncharacterized protein n=1 Tax=Penicillium freii TaxID=48697 RepID=A0A117NPM5_PENFR|nr:hypothetical protein ACN42_g4439 [Penicillium freii]